MGRLIAAVIFYEEAWTLERCLTSIRRAAPRSGIVAIDGAYAQFPHPDGRPESEDGSNVIAERLADEVIRCPRVDGRPVPWANEVAKRNAYLKAGREGDTYLVVDADEEVHGLVPEITGTEMDVLFRRDDSTPPGRYLRFYEWFSGLRYEGTHHALWNANRLMNEKPRNLAAGFWIKHYTEDRGVRNANRLKRKAEYYHWLENEEADFRRRHILV